ncbi:MAG: GTPase HflX [Alphaproteobacteria bacterium MarineAlpha9_Bin2]|nr:MAG: GTPase HflX [Alphaproteobacteria bacterium MarineAlpha9_Bin2]
MNGCLLLHPCLARVNKKNIRSPESSLKELKLLAKSISLKIVLSKIIDLSKINVSSFFGSGKICELKCILEKINDKNCLIIINSALTPIQQRNLEKSWNRKVLDRTALILEIFGSRARTKEALLQVELAHLEWQKSRLVKSWTHLERQRGGRGFMGGPGELQIELDKRQINARIKKIKQDLKKVINTRTIQRKKRNKIYPIISLVGYTNTGKSTLFNLLTGASEFSRDLLFDTLHSKHRKVSLYNYTEFILSDTVGFVSDLPTELIESFKSTLEEIIVSDIIIHVRDISHEDFYSQNVDVRDIISSIFLADKKSLPPIIEVINKIDNSEYNGQSNVLNLSSYETNKIYISARTGEGIDNLRCHIDRLITDKKKYY